MLIIWSTHLAWSLLCAEVGNETLGPTTKTVSGVFTGGNEIEWVCSHAGGAISGTKSVVKRSSVTHYTPGGWVMTEVGKNTLMYSNMCVLPGWGEKYRTMEEWGENLQTCKCTAAWGEKVTRTSSGASLKYTENTHPFLITDSACTTLNLDSAWCDVIGRQESNHFYAVPQVPWWCVCRCRLDLPLVSPS